MNRYIPHFHHFVIALSLIFFPACLPVSEPGPIGPQGNGEGILGRTRTVLDYDNARTRCDFTRVAPREYDVTCVAVVKTPQGTELKATEILGDIEVAWQPPQQLTGAQASLSCQNELLTQNCRVALPAEDETLLEFKLRIQKVASNLSREATDQVRLPYGVETFGLVPQTTFYVARNPETTTTTTSEVRSSSSGRVRRRISSKMGSEPELLPATPLGVQVPTILPEHAYLGYPLSSCSVGEKTYFSVGNRVSATFSGGNIVYVSDKNGIRLFAGTYSNQPSYPPPDHRVRVSFSKGVHLICRPEGIYTIERESGRVLYLAESGSVTFIAGRTDDLPSSPSNPGPLYCPMASALKPNGQLVIPSSCQNQIKETSPSGQLTTLVSLPSISGQRPTAVASAPDGTLYVALGESNGGTGSPRIDKIAPNSNSLVPVLSNQEITSLISSQENNKTFNDYVIAVDASGALYFAGYGGSKIYKKSAETAAVVWAGSSWIPPSTQACQNELPDGEAMTEAQFSFITSLSFRSDGALDLTDRLHCRIRRVGIDGKVSTVVRMKTSFTSDGVMNKTLANAVFPRLVSLAMTQDGSLYFTEPYSLKIHKISADGKTLSHIEIPGVTGELGIQDSWKKHIAIAAGASNDLFVLTRSAPQLRKLTSQGDWVSVGNVGGELNSDYTDLSIGQDQIPYLTFRVNFGSGFSNAFSKIYQWNFSTSSPELKIGIDISKLNQFPMSSTAAPDGTIFYSGSAQSAIFKVQDEGNSIRIAGQLNARGFSGDGGEALQAKLSSPLTITSDRAGNLYFADSENGRIRKLTPQQNGNYFISTAFGGDSAKDCSGNVTQYSEEKNAESTIQQALARLCYYKVTDLSVQNTCHLPNGNIKIAFVQRYTDNGSIVRITRPCSTP